MADRPKPDKPEPDEVSKTDEEALLDEVRDLLQRADPVPDDVRATAEAAGKSLSRRRRRD